MNDNEITAEVAYAKALLAESQEKWTEVYENVVIPVTRSRTSNGVKYSKIMYDRNINDLSLYGMLYETMVHYGKLNLYLEKEDKGPLFLWLRTWTKGLILNYCKKNQNPVSEKDPNPPLVDVGVPESHSEAWEVVEKSFSELWRSNPMKAYVYVMKKYYDLPSKQIGSMLGLTANNVDQIYLRAKEEMKKLLLEMEGGAI